MRGELLRTKDSRIRRRYLYQILTMIGWFGRDPGLLATAAPRAARETFDTIGERDI